MFLATLSICASIVVGCASAPVEEGHEPSFRAREEVFAADYNRVWKALQIALALYPVARNDMDEGIIETKSIEQDAIWKSPHPIDDNERSSKYRLTARAFPGSLNGKPVVRVAIKKDIRYKTNFIDSSKALPSSGLEEEVLLYRVQRELEIDLAAEQAVRGAAP
jgi:hypothetical protein